MTRRKSKHLADKAVAEPMIVGRALVGASWAIGAIPVTRRRLRADGVKAECPRAPRLGRGAGAGVLAVIRLLRPTCLERALVLQQFFSVQGIDRDVVIGVNKDDNGMSAHAWLSGEDLVQGVGFVEIHRIAAKTAATPGSTGDVVEPSIDQPLPEIDLRDPELVEIDLRETDVRAAIDLIEDTRPTVE